MHPKLHKHHAGREANRLLGENHPGYLGEVEAVEKWLRCCCEPPRAEYLPESHCQCLVLVASEEAHPTSISETQLPSIEEDQPAYIEEAQPAFIKEARLASIEDPNAYNDDCLPSPLKNSDYFIGWGSSDGGRSPDSIKNPSPLDIDYSSVEAMLEMTRNARDEFRILYLEGSLEKLTDAELKKIWRCLRKWSATTELRMGTILDCNDVVDIAMTSEVGNRNSDFFVSSLLKKKRHATSGKQQRCKIRKELQGSTTVVGQTKEKQSKNTITRLEGLLFAVPN